MLTDIADLRIRLNNMRLRLDAAERKVVGVRTRRRRKKSVNTASGEGGARPVQLEEGLD